MASDVYKGLDPVPGFPERLALRVMQFGAIAVILAATRQKVFDLDRFLAPKELVLLVTAVLAGLLTLRVFRRDVTGRVDRLLLVYLLLSGVSAALATNRWVGLRALAVSAAGVAIFWAARGLRTSGLARPLLGALAFAVVLAAITSLLQAYGLRIDFFSLNRSPGGTLGNRNFVAHAAAIGFPVVLLAAFRARGGGTFLRAGVGVLIVTAALVLTRSRAAWLASAAVIVIVMGAMIASRSLRRDGSTWRRLAAAALFAAIGVGAALLVPNALHWRSDNPYLESVAGMTNYQEGSGRGRLVQYEGTLLMAIRHPLFGVGPGNWPVAYPEHAARHDPSLDTSHPGMTSNPWPSSDWIAFISERGFAAAILLALAFLSMALAAFRRLVGAADADEALNAVALLGTIAGAAIAGAFDAVLLLPLPTFLVWGTIGALWRDEAATAAVRTPATATLAMLAIVLVAAAGAARTTAQLVGMTIYSTSSDHAALERASRIDRGSYWLHLHLARGGRRNQRCDHARAAHALFPNAEAARRLARACGD